MTSACCDNYLSPPSISMVLSMVTMWREQGHCMYFYVGHLPQHRPVKRKKKDPSERANLSVGQFVVSLYPDYVAKPVEIKRETNMKHYKLLNRHKQ